MTNRSSESVAETPMESSDHASEADDDSPGQTQNIPTGRELVVIDRDDRSEGWFTPLHDSSWAAVRRITA